MSHRHRFPCISRRKYCATHTLPIKLVAYYLRYHTIRYFHSSLESTTVQQA